MRSKSLQRAQTFHEEKNSRLHSPEENHSHYLNSTTTQSKRGRKSKISLETSYENLKLPDLLSDVKVRWITYFIFYLI